MPTVNPILVSTVDAQAIMTVRAGPLDLLEHRAFWQGTPVDLTYREFTIVNYLASHPGVDVTYRQIYDIARGKDFAAGYGSEGCWPAVRSFICRIRRKFLDMDSDFAAIENYPGFGYRWKVDRQQGRSL